MIAAELPFPDVILTLLRSPALDRDARARADGRTALATAVAQGNAEAAQLLLLHDADPTVRDVEGRDALSLAGGDRACGAVLGEWARAYALARARVLVEGGRAFMAVVEAKETKGLLLIPCSDAGGVVRGGGGSVGMGMPRSRGARSQVRGSCCRVCGGHGLAVRGHVSDAAVLDGQDRGGARGAAAVSACCGRGGGGAAGGGGGCPRALERRRRGGGSSGGGGGLMIGVCTGTGHM